MADYITGLMNTVIFNDNTRVIITVWVVTTLLWLLMSNMALSAIGDYMARGGRTLQQYRAASSLSNLS
ncbi:MAG: hypothetical protein EOP45_07210 [Sphingobacteriaceae bacterium]|nr:MAG: hypothetical protein EOP45_07210 [Sphingobacteriaceae bacterium]